MTLPWPRRFDTTRLRPIAAAGLEAHTSPHTGPRTEALITACRLGTGPASRHWATPGGPVRIEMPFCCYQVSDGESARRACLALDGSWRMAKASAGGRWAMRAAALWADVAWWRTQQAHDAWDAGEAPNAAALTGFEPRRTTLIVIEGTPNQSDLRALAELERRAHAWPRAVRVLLVGAPPGTARFLPS